MKTKNRIKRIIVAACVLCALVGCRGNGGGPTGASGGINGVKPITINATGMLSGITFGAVSTGGAAGTPTGGSPTGAAGGAPAAGGAAGGATPAAVVTPLTWTAFELHCFVNGQESVYPLTPNSPSLDIANIKPGDTVYAYADITLSDGSKRKAESDTITIERGNNKLSLYMPYNVIFDLNNGGRATTAGTWADGTTAQTKYINNVTKKTIASNMPTVSASTPYTFTGWNMNQNGTGAAFVAGGTKLYDGLTMYAQYKQETMSMPADMVFVPAATTNIQVADSKVFIDGRNLTINAFYICDHEVTQAEYQAIMNTNPSNFQGSSNLPATGEEQQNRPVEKVSWYDALVYCNRRSIEEDFTPCYTINGSTDPNNWGTVPISDTSSTKAQWDAVTCDWNANGYRLPTEAEWEYAVRGGNLTNTGQTTYAGSDAIDDVAWCRSNSDSKTHEVKKKTANGLALYDMSGNVYEWCWDWYTGSITTTTPVTGPTSGSNRVLRGGCWDSSADNCAVSYRYLISPYYRNDYVGFRVVRSGS